MRRRRWSHLPTDLLREIAGRLHVASDFVRFHTVCKSWRSSHDPTCAKNKTTTDQFLPWLLAPNQTYDESIELGCVFSKSSYLVRPPLSCRGRNRVGSADGTAVCYFTSNYLDGSTLHDPLTGTPLIHLPLLLDGHCCWKEENPCGIIYNDGTVLLYRAYIRYGETMAAEVRAALLRPGDDNWTIINRTFEFPKPNHREFCIAYHGGKIFVTVERSHWRVIPLTKTPATASDDVLVRRPSSMPPPYTGNDFYEYSHVLESRGELLWVLVYVSIDFPDKRFTFNRPVRVGSVSVHALTGAPAAPQWVRKEGNSLADRVFFLGWPNSFAVDATQLGVVGGFVYFMYDVEDEDDKLPHERRVLFKYNLINKTTEFVDRLPTGWNGARCTWLIPQPIIAPIRHGSATTLPREK